MSEVIILKVNSAPFSRPKSIKVIYKLSNKEIKNKLECCLGIGFDNTFKADNHILSLVNGMIDWMV